MQYRDCILRFLANYREYHFDCFQLVVLEHQLNKQKQLINLIQQQDSLNIYQVKNVQVLNRVTDFNNVSNTFINLLFQNPEASIYDLEDSDLLSKYTDLYTLKKLKLNTYRYLHVYPIYSDELLIGGIFIYNNYNLIWQFSNLSLVQFLNELEIASNNDILASLEKEISSKYWSFERGFVYLSSELTKLIDCHKIVEKFDYHHYHLKQIDSKKVYDGELVSYEYIPKAKVESYIELKNLELDQFTIVYLRNQTQKINDFVDTIQSIIYDNCQSLGKYHLFLSSSDSITVVFENNVTKKVIEQLFGKYQYVLIRKNIELFQKIDFQSLIDYLNLSSMEPFNLTYYKYYLEHLLSEKHLQVSNLLTPTKIKVTPFYDARTMIQSGVIISDPQLFTHAQRDVQIKSMNAILKLAEEYVGSNIIIKSDVLAIFRNERVNTTVLNQLKAFILQHRDRVKWMINVSDEEIKKLSHYWFDVNDYLMIIDEHFNFYDLILKLKEIKNVAVVSEQFVNLLADNHTAALEIAEFLMNKTDNVLLRIKQNDIIKISGKKVLFTVERV